MTDSTETKHPWVVAAWPGMGGVALAAASYLAETLGARPLTTLDLDEHFDVDKVRLDGGVIATPRPPATRLFGWHHPAGGPDLVIVVGEAQPTHRSFEYCQRVVRAVRDLGARRVYTFASMVVPIHPSQPSSVHAIATSRPLLEEALRASPGARSLGEGEISGVNGTFLAAAAEEGLEGVGLLADVPPMAVSVPYLKASHAVLEAFARAAGIDLDLERLAKQAQKIERGLLDVLERVKQVESSSTGEARDDDDEGPTAGVQAEPEDAARPALDADAVARIESLFLEARVDRSRAVDLKSELDRHGRFKEYEDRFLNLFSSKS